MYYTTYNVNLLFSLFSPSLPLFSFSFSLSLLHLLKEVSSHLKDPILSEADPPYYQSIVRMYLKHLSSLFTDALVSLCMVNTCTCVAVKNINI